MLIHLLNLFRCGARGAVIIWLRGAVSRDARRQRTARTVHATNRQTELHCTSSLKSFRNYFVPSSRPPLSVGLCVYVSVREHISAFTCPSFTRFSVHVACGRGSVLLRRRCKMLYASGFVDDVLFPQWVPWRK